MLPMPKFNHCVRLDEFTSIPVPRQAMRLVIQEISNFFRSIKEKKNQKPGELNGATIAMILLSVASVLGIEF